MRLQLTVKMFWQADKVNRQGEKEMQARVEPQFGKRTPAGVLEYQNGLSCVGTYQIQF